MDITFGLITAGDAEERLKFIIRTIENEHIPNYEILIIGPSKVSGPNIRVIPFNELLRGKGWITKKKNIIAQEAQYDYIVMSHDYFFYHPGWYKGWLSWYEWEPFNLAVNRILTREGQRHSDLLLDMFDVAKTLMIPENDPTYWDVLLPYDRNDLSQFQYISGGWFMIRKEFALRHPQREELGWGEREDIVWSQHVRRFTDIDINTASTVQIMKPGKWAPKLIDPERLDRYLKLRYYL